jgi:HK97 gp10 family phage protein
VAKYVSNRKAVDDVLLEKALVVLTTAGELVTSAAKLLCPVDTGRLRNSITYQVNTEEKEVVIGTPVEYAPEIELGTSRKQAQPFLNPALFESARQINEVAKREFGDIK